ncbi:MAG: proteasome-activating nucleotidase [Candidatus Hydrothermarchaeota archaeon]|nr:MAG: proteasome-activating nucleotidase [Candidatus Hydrothermarchaeota archaeon]
MSEDAKNKGEDLTAYLLNRVRELERECLQLSNENLRLKNGYSQRVKWLEDRKRILENEKLLLEREVRKLRSELERLRSMPLVVGTLQDILPNGKVVVRSSGGPTFVVGISQFIDQKSLVPGARVAMNQQSLAVVDVLPFEKDPAVLAMEIVEKPKESYSDIGGLQEQIREIKETVELPLVNPKIFEEVGIDPPKGVLLYGPPGTGKTLIAKAVAHETNSVFIKLIGSELVRKYIGEGARLVRELFRLAKEKAPSIVFIDEIDAIGAKRLDSSTSGDREVQRTLMQLLAEMDGFDARGDVRIIAATNRPDILDPAMLRPGRFDRLIEIPLPDHEGRIEIFKIHTRKMNLSEDISYEELAKETEGASGADIKAICTEAGMFAIRENRNKVTSLDFSKAIDKILGKYEGVGKEVGVMYT